MHNKVSPIHGEEPVETPAPRRAHVIAITSGKGGVGKTNISTNLAIGLARQGHRVCIFDADTGLANINILLGLTPTHTLAQVLDGTLEIDDILLDGPGGMKIVPGASGIAEFADLDRQARQMLFNSLQKIEGEFDYLIIDTAAGIADTVVQFVCAAEQAVLVLSPDPTSLTDAFALTRLLLRQHYRGGLQAIVNMAESSEAARRIFTRFGQAVQKYLHTEVGYLGHVIADRAVVSAVRLQHPVMLVSPESAASRCLQRLAVIVHQQFGTTAGQGFSSYWRKQQAETPVEHGATAADIVTTTPATPGETNLDKLNRQFVDCIQDDKGEAEEFVAAIKPIVDAYVTRFKSFPIDMKEAISRYLQVADFPEQEIRKQLDMLEQLYEERFQRPLMDKEDSLFRLLQQVRDSEIEFAATIQRLQHSYESQYRPEASEALERFIASLDQLEISREDYQHCMERLRAHYSVHFDLPDPDEVAELRGELEQLAEESAGREKELQEHLVSLMHLIAGTQDSLGRINELRDRLKPVP